MRWALLILLLIAVYMWWAGKLPTSVASYLPPPPSSTNDGPANPPPAPVASSPGAPPASAPPVNPFTPHSILDCSFQIPSDWEVYSTSGDKFGARSGNKSFEVTTFARTFNIDFDSAAFSNVMMLISPHVQANVMAETRDPFRGHSAYNALVRTPEAYRGITMFALGNTYYVLARIEDGANPFNDPQLNAIVDSVTLADPPTH